MLILESTQTITAAASLGCLKSLPGTAPHAYMYINQMGLYTYTYISIFASDLWDT